MRLAVHISQMFFTLYFGYCCYRLGEYRMTRRVERIIRLELEK